MIFLVWYWIQKIRHFCAFLDRRFLILYIKFTDIFYLQIRDLHTHPFHDNQKIDFNTNWNLLLHSYISNLVKVYSTSQLIQLNVYIKFTYTFALTYVALFSYLIIYISNSRGHVHDMLQSNNRNQIVPFSW